MAQYESSARNLVTSSAKADSFGSNPGL